MTKNTYTARYEFDEDTGQWTAELAELPQVHTYGRSIKKARDRLREALWAFTDDKESADAAVLVDDVVESPDLKASVASAQRERAELERLRESADNATRHALDHLVEHGYTMREAADRLGISHQRVGQLMPGGSRRLTIVSAAERLKITPKRYREILTGMADADLVRHRSVTSEIHEQVAKKLAR